MTSSKVKPLMPAVCTMITEEQDYLRRACNSYLKIFIQEKPS